MEFRVLIALVALGVQVAACEPAPMGPPCTSDSECSAGAYCAAAGCRTDCTTTDHCEPGERCTPRGRCEPAGDGGTPDAATCEGDVDGDGHESFACEGDDCDDDDRNRFPGNVEVCDASDHDEDCDPATFGFRDSDADGFADRECCNPDGATTRCGTDCDDNNPNVHPTESEACDELDNDCDDATDEGVQETYYVDADGDMFGVDGMTTQACALPSGYAIVGFDCDDTDAAIQPSATDEDCDGVNDDCDADTDESAPIVDCYADGDGDDYAPSGATMSTAMCTCAAGTTSRAPGVATTDCNDAAPLVSPGRPEQPCNTIDDDCNTATSDESRPEVCDGVPNDCDANVDEGWACALGATRACQTTCDIPFGASTGTQTCVAGCAWGPCVPPAETCNGRDDDCNGPADDGGGFTCVRGSTVSCTTGCSGGDPGTGTCTATCTLPTGPACIPPPERCNGGDDDCDTRFDEGVADGCRQGSTGLSCGVPACPSLIGAPVTGTRSCDSSCRYTSCRAASESCNACDDDGDTRVDEGFGGCVRGTTVSCVTGCTGGDPGMGTCTDSCTPPTGSACIRPAERCNGGDEDCDTRFDEGVPGTDGCRQSTTGHMCTVPSCPSLIGPPVMGFRDCDTSCRYGACRGSEACNACDDDGDARVDEGFGGCTRGTTVACRDSCGGMGARGTCTSSCAPPMGWPDCRVRAGQRNDVYYQNQFFHSCGFACCGASPTAWYTYCGDGGIPCTAQYGPGPLVAYAQGNYLVTFEVRTDGPAGQRAHIAVTGPAGHVMNVSLASADGLTMTPEGTPGWWVATFAGGGRTYHPQLRFEVRGDSTCAQPEFVVEYIDRASCTGLSGGLALGGTRVESID